MAVLQNVFKIVLLTTVLAWPLAFAAAGDGSAYQACADLFPGSVIPDGPTNNTLEICKTAKDADHAPIFASLQDTKTKIPVWTAHRLTPEQLKTIRNTPAFGGRKDFFAEYPDVPLSDQSDMKNYVGSGYDRGHQVRALDLNWSVDAYKTSYVMTNMAPQTPNLNRGAWLGLEDQFQTWVGDKNTTLWAFAGSWGQNADPANLKDKPTNTVVPACFYKVIVAQGDDGAYKVISAVFPQELPDRKRKVWVNYISSLDIVEKRSGLDFLKGLATDQALDTDYWGVEAPVNPSDCS